MTAGETLLKITDIPFSYSLLAIIMGVMGVKFEGVNLVLLIGTAGVLGTFLTATDPVGRLLKSNLKAGISQLRKKDKNPDDVKWGFAKNAIETRAIGLEIDKFVSMFYLALILIVFSSAVTNFPEFTDNLQLYGDDGKTICDNSCAGIVSVIFSGIAAVFLAIVGMKSWKALKYNVIVAGVHHRGISSEFVTATTIENMSRAIEQNDWQTASEWAKIIENEIITEKGKKDFNIESVRQVYRPLYEESISIQTTAQNILNNNNLNATFPSGEWASINSTTLQLMIKDESLIEKLSTMYRKISEYNEHPRNLELQIKQIIQQEATKFYGKHVENVRYFFTHQKGGSSPDLLDCLRAGEHPSKRNVEPYDSRYIELQTTDMSQERVREEGALTDFDKLWEIMLNRVRDETMTTKLKNLAKEIQKSNDEIKPIFEERINKQWP